MPGNGVGDRVHNFFEHENFSQGQHQPQGVDGNWQGLSSNLRIGNQRQASTPLSSNQKNYAFQHPDSERDNGSPSFRVPDGLNYTQPNGRADFSKHQPQYQQQNSHNHVLGHHLQTTQGGGSPFRFGGESDRQFLSPRLNSTNELQQESGPGHNRKNSSLEASQSPVNFNFPGGQQHINSQQMGMLQPPRHQPDFNDMHLLQQQVMLKQMQEFQMQQQVQQLEARQNNSPSQLPFSKQSAGHPLNGTSVHDSSNYPWSPELMACNSNWLQRNTFPIPSMQQGSFNGLVLSPEQAQARSMGLVPQQVDQSLYGVPVSSSRGSTNQYSHVQGDKPAVPQMAGCSNTLPVHKFGALHNQSNIEDNSLVPRQCFQGKNVLENAHLQGFNSGVMLENSLQANSLQANSHQNSGTAPEFHDRRSVGNTSDISQEKPVQIASSQSLPTLDPTEEKILFGSDTNLWEAFGSNSNSMLNGIDSVSAYSSVQSGTWSALMQSAVGETSSGDLQEDWSSIGFQNAEPSTGNSQPVSLNDSGKQQRVWAENRVQMASPLESRPPPGNNDMKTYHGSVLEEQSELSLSQEYGSDNRSLQQSAESRKWLGQSPLQKPVAEANRLHASSNHSSDGDFNVKMVPGSSTQESISLYNHGPRICNKSDVWNATESLIPSSTTLKPPESAKFLHHNQGNNLRRSVQDDEMGHGSLPWRADSVSNLNLHANRGDSRMSNLSRAPNSSALKMVQEASQLQNDYHLESLNRGDDFHKYQHLTSTVQGMGPSADKAAIGSREVEESSDRKENSSDSYGSNVSHHTSDVGMRDNVQLDASDSRSLPGGKQKSHGHVTRGVSGPRKFQYHPMGNLDMDPEPSYGPKHVLHSQPMSQQVPRGLKSLDQGYIEQSQPVGNFLTNHMERKKGKLPDSVGGRTMLDDAPSGGSLRSFVHNKSSPFGGSFGLHDTSKPTHSSENMLDLLHKVDQSRDGANIAKLGNQSSGTLETKSLGASACHEQRNQSSAFQGFGLQLGPPSQRSAFPNNAVSSQSSSWVISSLTSSQASPDIGTDPISLKSTDAGRQMPHQTSEGQNPKNQLHNQQTVDRNGQVKTDESFNRPCDGHESGFVKICDSHDRPLTGEPEPETLAESTIPHAESFSLAGNSHTSTRQSHGEGSSQRIPMVEAKSVSLSSPMTDPSLQGAVSTAVPNRWTNVSVQQQLSDADSFNSPSNLLKSHHQFNTNANMMSATEKINDRGAHTARAGQSDGGTYSVNSHGIVLGEKQLRQESPLKQVSSDGINLSQRIVSEFQGKGSINHSSDVSASNMPTSRRDIEAFGRSLRPTNFLHQNYSTHQVQGMKPMEVDPSYCGWEKSKGLESGPETQQAFGGAHQASCGNNSGVRDASMGHPLIVPGDSKVLKFPSHLGDYQLIKPYSQHTVGTVHSQEMLSLARGVTQDSSSTHNTASVRAERCVVSPQMAPSWFEQFGSFKNRQMLQMYEAQKLANVKAQEQHNLGKSSMSDSCNSHLANSIPQSSTRMPTGTECLSSQTLPADSAAQCLSIVKPKKRKRVTYKHLSWHKEVIQGPQNFYDVSIAHINWAYTSNRLVDKMGDDTEMLDDGPPLLRSKRRLIYTTQLMQQLFHPPLASVISADAGSDPETVIYLVARLALSDACSLASQYRSDMPVLSASGNIISDKLKSSEVICDQYFVKVMEGLVGRSKKLEKDVLGLDRRASILDLRVESIDLEKFSMFNRFAKFHGRGQTDGTDASSSYDAIANAQRSSLQRYVNALPMPKHLPDRVQCLSL